MESKRRSGRREESRRRHLSRSTSRQLEQDIQIREVMASRHYLSRMPPDRSRTMEKSRELNADRRQSLRTTDHQRSSMHLHHQQPTKDTDKRARTHKLKQGSVLEKQSRKKHSKSELLDAPKLSEEPQNSQPADMPPRQKRAV